MLPSAAGRLINSINLLEIRDKDQPVSPAGGRRHGFLEGGKNSTSYLAL